MAIEYEDEGSAVIRMIAWVQSRRAVFAASGCRRIRMKAFIRKHTTG